METKRSWSRPRSRRRAAGLRVQFALAATVVLWGAAGFADDLQGPPFGSNSVESAIVDVAGAPDRDEFVAELSAGERITVDVAAVRGSALRPTLLLLDPDGAEAARAVTTVPAGLGAKLAPFTIPRSGRWAVCVLAADPSEGAYTVRFRIASPKTRKTAGKLGGTAPLTFAEPIDAAQGTVATISIGSRERSEVQVVGISDPKGDPIATVPARTTNSSSRVVLSDLPLLAGTGTYRVTVGIQAGRASFTLRTKLVPPERPIGSSVLSSDEPFLPERASPLEGLASQPVRIEGGHLPRSTLPDVYFGDSRALVLRVGPGGSYVDVVPPPAPDGALVAVSVVNPDGQSTRRPAYFRYAPASTPPLKALSPAVTQIYANELATFFVDTTLAAPSTGRQVTLSVTNKIATLPPTVTVAAATSAGSFVVQAAATSGSGLLTATAGNSVSATVTILPARRVDLSSWRIVQSSAAATFVIPPGTVIEAGGFLVVGRNASRAAFEGYWGRTLPANVVYVNSSGTFPLIDGAERFVLTLPSGVVQDGQTIALASGMNYARVPGKAAGTTSSWTVTTATNFNASPGAGPPATVALPYISEFSDVAPGGNAACQFVEIRFDRGQ